MNIQETCQHLLPGMDEDVLAYIVSMIEDQMDDLSEISDGIAGFILSSEYTDNEEKADELCQQIITTVRNDSSAGNSAGSGNGSGGGGGGGGTCVSKGVSDEPQLLKNKVVISKESAQLLPPPPSKKEEIQMNFGRAEIKSGSKAKSSRKTTTAAARVYGQALQLEEELEAARVYAAKARTRDGAFNGALGECLLTHSLTH
jgi:hypothetical protein